MPTSETDHLGHLADCPLPNATEIRVRETEGPWTGPCNDRVHLASRPTQPVKHPSLSFFSSTSNAEGNLSSMEVEGEQACGPGASQTTNSLDRKAFAAERESVPPRRPPNRRRSGSTTSESSIASSAASRASDDTMNTVLGQKGVSRNHRNLTQIRKVFNQRCFVTGIESPYNEGAHLISAFRGKKNREKRERIVRRV